MEGIKIEVTGNIARVIEKPSRITSGTVGLPVEFTFDSQWGGLSKVAVFRAGHTSMAIDLPGTSAIVPWEVIVKPNVWLSVGVYGTNADGTVVIPTIWANVCVIHIGVDPDGDTPKEPTLNIWRKLEDEITTVNNRIDGLVKELPAKLTEVTILASAWTGSNSLYSQVVTIEGITPYSKVDLLPSVVQLAIFHNKDVAFVTENEDGVVTVFAIGDKPTQDYTMQVSITEVTA